MKINSKLKTLWKDLKETNLKIWEKMNLNDIA